MLYENYKELNISKSTVCIFNPFDLDVKSRRVQSALYKEILAALQEDPENLAKINAIIEDCIVPIINLLPYPIHYDDSVDLTGLLKSINVEMLCEGNSFIERIMNYITVLHRLCNFNIFVFHGLKKFLLSDDFKLLYEYMCYEKIYFLLVESDLSHTKIFEEKYWILDGDLCIIKPD